MTKIFTKDLQRETSLKVKKNTEYQIVNINIYKLNTNYSYKCYKITIITKEKMKLSIGDKLSGRHGNKGVISKIVPNEDMPYLPDGKPLDIILNPLGIPSRMNVGQIFETLLGLAGKYLKERYRTKLFNEMKNNNSLEIVIYKKLIESRKKTKKKWLFNANYPGKIKILNGITGKTYEQPVLIGYSYILKLMHLAKEKISARLTGPYSKLSQQPLKGKSKGGGQRVGEMEMWALEAYGAAYVIQELLTLKSDDVTNRSITLNSIIMNKNLPKPNVPEAFKFLILELQCLCIDIKIYRKDKTKSFFF
jgi:DNA-directed RNA polymerase subunit beta